MIKTYLVMPNIIIKVECSKKYTSNISGIIVFYMNLFITYCHLLF